MDARTAIVQVHDVAAAVRRPLQLPARPICLVMADRIASIEAAPTLPSAPDLAALRQLLLMAGDIASLPRRALRLAPFILWNGRPRGSTIDGLWRTLLIMAERSASMLTRLIEAWLRDFDVDALDMADAAPDLVARLDSYRQPRLQAWRVAHERLALLDPCIGPDRIAGKLLNERGDIDAMLAEIGMQDRLRANGGYFRTVTHRLLSLLPKALLSLDAEQAWGRVEQVMILASTTAPARASTQLRFGQDRARFASQILAAWQQGSPVATLRPPVQACLLKVMGDPRIDPARWVGVDAAAVQLMRVWLSKASLETFFDIISTGGDRRWAFRKRFWEACFAKCPDAEVWVVLGSGLARTAKRVEDLQGNFGRMSSAANANQAVLLIKVGAYVLSEWSDIGPIRAYEASDSDAPRLYRRDAYRLGELRLPCLAFPNHPVYFKGGTTDGSGLRHQGADHYLWQGCAAAFLEEHVGVRLDPKDYRL